MNIKQMINIFKMHNVVTFTLTGLGETIMNTEQFEDVLNEIDRLVEIGRATEQWFKEGHIMEYGYNEIYTVNDLLDWKPNA